ENDGVKRDGANLGSKKYSLGTKSVRGVDGKTTGAVACPVDFSGMFSTYDDSRSNEESRSNGVQQSGNTSIPPSFTSLFNEESS
nr:hypothetical protein [Tanacetum cinerariifolium]